ncbi:transcription termination factor MTERF8, chloroplastic-like [Rutidosis leptorrhynchoides]|uniref:transcription termination factor MTERF8, chloroplastic-like n=1 Tax=Rutidosis leptorrhynchoides TaxID=125765 RepID=UPI003A9A46FC
MSLRTYHKLMQPFLRNNGEHFAPLFSSVPSTNLCSTSSDSNNLKTRDYVKSVFESYGFSDTLLGKCEKFAPKFSSSKEFQQTVQPKFDIFRNMGLSTAQIAIVFSAYPRILIRVPVHYIERSVAVLKKVLGDKLYDARILKNIGWLLNSDYDKTLVPNVEYLRSCQIEESQIMQLFYHYPRFLLHKAENFKEFVRRVDELGVDRGSKLFVYAVRTVGSMSLESWEQKLDVFRGLGFSEVDIVLTFRKFPNVFALSDRKIKETAEFLVSSGRYDRSFICRYPYVLIFSLDRRIKPRLRVLEILEREKILEINNNKTPVLIMSDSKFFAKFVEPHLDKVDELSFMVKDAKA